MMPPREEPLRDLIANALVLAESLENDRRPQAGALVRELVQRVVPMKVVRTGGSHPRKLVHEPIEPIIKFAAEQAKRGQWCDQCERLVQKGCQSRFCKVAA